MLLPRPRGTQDPSDLRFFFLSLCACFPRVSLSHPSAALSLFLLQNVDNCSFSSYLECSSTISSQAVAFFTVGIQCQIPLDVSLAPVGKVPPLPVCPPGTCFSLTPGLTFFKALTPRGLFSCVCILCLLLDTLP